MLLNRLMLLVDFVVNFALGPKFSWKVFAILIEYLPIVSQCGFEVKCMVDCVHFLSFDPCKILNATSTCFTQFFRLGFIMFIFVER